MPIQSTLAFRSVDGEPLQWREIWWSLGTDPSAAVTAWNAAGGGGGSLLQIRQKFLSNSAEIYYLKCTAYNPPNPKVSVVSRLFPTLRGQGTPSDYLGVSIAFQLEIPGHRRPVSIRGIPDEWVQDNQITPVGTKGIQGIISGVAVGAGKLVGNAGGYFRALQDRLSAGIYENVAPARYPGSGIVNGVAGNIQIDFPAAFIATVQKGDLIVITATPSMPLLRGTWKIADIDAVGNTITLAGSSFLRAVTGAVCVGRAGINSVDNTTWTVNVVGPRTRDTGRPTTGPRGRRSARIRHR